MWHIRWDRLGLLIPFDELRQPIWLRQSDVAYVHALLDQWTKQFDLASRLPCFGTWSSWWTCRYELQRRLVNILPYFRMLKEIALNTSLSTDEILLESPPESWWPLLFKVMFPESRVTVTESRNLGPGNSKPQENVFAMRREAAESRIHRYLSGCHHRPRVLVISRDKAWNGEYNFELDSAIKTLETNGFEVVIVSRAQTKEDAKCSFATRPTSHLFVEMLCKKDNCESNQLPSYTLPRKGFEIDGVDVSPLVAKLIEDYIPVSYAQFGMFAETLPQLAKDLHVEAAVLTDEHMGNQAIKYGLLQAGIPMVAVQHACIYEDHLNYVYPPGTPRESIGFCNMTCVYGKHTKDILTQKSIYSDESVIITGQPQMDYRSISTSEWGERSESGEQLRKRYFSDNCRRLLLFTSQGWNYRALVADRFLESFAASAPCNCLVVRPHPNNEGPLAFWTDAIRKYGIEKRTIITKEGSLEAWLDACDVHISATSTVLGEAAVLGRPNITVGSRFLGDWLGCLRAGVAVELEDFPSLDAALNFWLEADSEKQQEFEIKRRCYISNYFHKIDGCTGERIAAAVEKIVSKTMVSR